MGPDEVVRTEWKTRSEPRRYRPLPAAKIFPDYSDDVGALAWIGWRGGGEKLIICVRLYFRERNLDLEPINIIFCGCDWWRQWTGDIVIIKDLGSIRELYNPKNVDD